MADTPLDADTAGPLHLIDLVRSLVGSGNVVSMEHEAALPSLGDDGENGCWAHNGSWADSLMQSRTCVCLEDRRPQRGAGDAGPGPAAVALKHQVGLLHNPNVMFDFSWSADLSGLMRRPATGVQVPEHVIGSEAVPTNTAAQPSSLPVPLDPVPGAGRQKTPTLSRRCRPPRFTRAAVVRTLMVSPDASPSRCTSPLQLRNDANASPSRCASRLQPRNVAGRGFCGATGKTGNCYPSFVAATSSSLLPQSIHEHGIGKEATRFHCKHKGCDKVYRHPDRVRKHCLAKHREWFNSLEGSVGGRDQAFGPSDYCSWKSGR